MREKRRPALSEEQEFALFLDNLKDVERRNPLARNPRRERVAEHSWHVAISVMVLAQACPVELDVPRAVQMALVHDLAELYVGDTFAYGPDVDTKHSREQAAMDLLDRRSRSKAVRSLVELWREYERQESPTARFVKAIDSYLPIALNHANLPASSWAKYGVSAGQVEKRLDHVRDLLGDLAKSCDAWIADAKTLDALS